ncbi:molecular chaperone DnaJ, partial [Mangrovimonas sp. AS39]|uniref:DnaJ C-terminal domain-containing protein n=1 Tax=Mangrovimonas futianensis TaxID=2895523 RepID=UPI002343096D
LGSEKTINTLEGPLGVKIPAGITHGEVLRVRGKGVPEGRGKRGDLLIRVGIVMPNKLSKKAKELIDKLKEEGI